MYTYDIYPPAAGRFETSQLTQQSTKLSKDLGRIEKEKGGGGGKRTKKKMTKKKKEIVFSVPAASGRIRNSYGSRPRWTSKWSTRLHTVSEPREASTRPGCDVDATPVFQSPSSNAGRSPVDRLAARTTPLQQTPRHLSIHEPFTTNPFTRNPAPKKNSHPASWKIQSLSARERRAQEARVETHSERHPSVRREKEKGRGVSFLASKKKNTSCMCEAKRQREWTGHPKLF